MINVIRTVRVYDTVKNVFFVMENPSLSPYHMFYIF